MSYENMPAAKWDGRSNIYSQLLDIYYDSPDIIDCQIPGQTLADLQLVICVPNYVPLLDLDYGQDELPDDDDEPPPELASAINMFNESVKGLVLSWSPGPYRLDLTGL